VAFRLLGLVASQIGKRNIVAKQTKPAVLALADAPENTLQFIKAFAGLPQLGSRWPCGSRIMPLKRRIELSAE
jgi:hypothetical protein